MGGLLILALPLFQIDDQIGVGDTEGAVERIQLRATQQGKSGATTSTHANRVMSKIMQRP